MKPILFLIVSILLISCSVKKDIPTIRKNCWEKAISYSEWMSDSIVKEYAATDFYCGCMESQGLNPWINSHNK